MIKYKQAPAGFIAQLYTDEELPYEGVPNKDAKGHHYLGVVGDWSPDLKSAIETLNKHRKKEVKKLQKNIDSLMTKMKDLQDLINKIESASGAVVE